MKTLLALRDMPQSVRTLCPRCGHPLQRIEHGEATAWPVDDYLCPACRSLFVAGPRGCTLPALHEIALIG